MMKYCTILTTLVTANLAFAYHPDEWQDELSLRDLDPMSTILLARGFMKSPRGSKPRQRGSPTAGQAKQEVSQQPSPPPKGKSLSPSQKEELKATDQGMRLAPDVADSIGSIHRAVSPDRRVSTDKKQQRRDLNLQEDINLLPRSSSARSSIRNALGSVRSYKAERPLPKTDFSNIGAAMLSPGARLPAEALNTRVSAKQGKPERQAVAKPDALQASSNKQR